MHHNHLRPDEIDLLLDGEDGFGVAPLRAHVRQCAECTAELERAQEFMLVMETLPDFAPSPSFADKVMSQVQVFEPWHVAALDTARQFVPASRPARMAAGVGAVVGAGALTAGATWLLERADIAVLLAQVGLERLQDRVGDALGSLVVSAVGQSGLELIKSGSPETTAFIVGGFVAAVGLGVMGLRAAATANRQRVQSGRPG